MFLFVNYCSDMLWLQFLAISRELISFLTCAAYVSTYLYTSNNLQAPRRWSRYEAKICHSNN